MEFLYFFFHFFLKIFSCKTFLILRIAKHIRISYIVLLNSVFLSLYQSFWWRRMWFETFSKWNICINQVKRISPQAIMLKLMPVLKYFRQNYHSYIPYKDTWMWSMFSSPISMSVAFRFLPYRIFADQSWVWFPLRILGRERGLFQSHGPRCKPLSSSWCNPFFKQWKEDIDLYCSKFE